MIVRSTTGGRLLDVLTFLIAVAALIIAIAAYARTGGMRDLRRQVDSITSTTEGMREKTADVLSRMERLIRGREKAPPEQERAEDRGDRPPSA